MALNPVTNKIYVANEGPLTTVTVIDVLTGSSQTVNVLVTPFVVAVNPVTNKIYVASASGAGGTIYVLDGSTNNIIATLKSTDAALAINTVTNKIYAVGIGVTVIDGATDTVVKTITEAGPGLTGLSAVAINPVTNTIYAANSNTESLVVIDAATDTHTNTVPLLEGPPNVVAVNPVTNTVYVGSERGVIAVDGATNNTTQIVPPLLDGSFAGAKSIAINPVTNKIYVGYASRIAANTVIGEIDGATNIETPISAGLHPASVAVNVLSNQVYVANLGAGTATIIDGASHASTTLSVGSNPAAVVVNPVTNSAYVLNRAAPPVAGSVQLISQPEATNVTLSTGSIPFAVAVDPILNKAYVANDGSNDVTVIDGSTNVTTTVPAGTNPFAVAVDPFTGKAFVTNQGSNDVTVIDGASNVTTRIPVGMAPKAIAVDFFTRTAYVANSGSNSVSAMNEDTGATASVPTGSTPVALAVNLVTNRIYVVDQGSNDVTVINGATNTTTSIPVGSSPDAVGVNPNTNKIYVADRGDNDVTVIDGATGTTSRVTVGTSPIALAVNPITNKIYVANEGSDDVTVIDGTNNSATPVVVGALPEALAINPGSNQIYVADNASNDVTVINGVDNSTSTFPGGAGPVSVAFDPVASKLYVADIEDKATVLTVGTPTPLVTKVTPFANNTTTVSAQTFTFTTSSSYAPAAPQVVNVLYQLDTLQGPWVVASGSAPTFTSQALPLTIGTHILYAYALDAQASLTGGSFNPSFPGGQYITGSLTAYFFLVTPVGTQTTLTSDKNPSQVGDTVNFTAVVAPAPPATGTPTGAVDFFDGTTLLGSVALDSKGNSVFTTSALAAGMHQITAKYEGDSTFAGSASAALTQTVNENFTVAANPNALTITHGQSGTSTLTITPAGGADTVAIAFSCMGLPAGSTCTFSPATVTPGLNPATTTMTIQTAGSALGVPPFDGPVRPPGLVILCALAAALCAAAALYSRQKRLRWVPAACLLAAIGFAALVTACNGGAAPAANPAPTGKFTVTVHATASSVDKTTTIALTVN